MEPERSCMANKLPGDRTPLVQGARLGEPVFSAPEAAGTVQARVGAGKYAIYLGAE